MNALIALTILTLSGSAQARSQDTYCHSTDIADGGYIFVLAKDRKSAELSEQTIAGPRLIGKMTCLPLNNPGYPDEIKNTAACRIDNMGGGWIVRLFEGGIAFQRYAELSTFAVVRDDVQETPVEFGHMSCAR